jgi:hypothetical protein
MRDKGALQRLANCEQASRKAGLRMRMFLFLLLAIAIIAPVRADSSSGMGAMQYYVGRWSCTGANVGRPPIKAQITYTLDSGVLRSLIIVAPQGKMKSNYTLTFNTTYDGKHDRYVQVSNDTQAASTISFVKMPNANLEQWTDYAAYNQKPGHGQTVRNSQNSFTVTSYPTLSSTKPGFKATCRRSS